MIAELRKRSEGGQALVELVVVLPLLLMLLSAVLHFGCLFYVQLGLNSAVCQAASFAARRAADDQAILKAIRDSLPTIVNRSTVTIVVLSGPTRNLGDLLSIRVEHDIGFLKLFPFGAFIPAPTKVFTSLTFPILVGA